MSGWFPNGASGGGGTASGGLQLGVLSPAALAAGQTNDYAPGLAGSIGILRLTPDAADSMLSGIVPVASTFAYCLFLVNVATVGNLWLLDETGSSAANQFDFPGDLILPPDAAQGIFYDVTSQRWRLLS